MKGFSSDSNDLPLYSRLGMHEFLRSGYFNATLNFSVLRLSYTNYITGHQIHPFVFFFFFFKDYLALAFITCACYLPIHMKTLACFLKPKKKHKTKH